MSEEFVEHCQDIIESELTARRQDVEYGLLRVDGFDAKERLTEELVFVERIETSLDGLLAELENRDAEIVELKKHLADYHQDACALLAEGEACTCESAPPLLKISDFEPLEAVLVSPADDESPRLRIVSGIC